MSHSDTIQTEKYSTIVIAILATIVSVFTFHDISLIVPAIMLWFATLLQWFASH